MRQLVVTKIAAATLIALILLPFTAPFKTYALATPGSQHSDDQLVKDKLGYDEKLVETSGQSYEPVVVHVLVIAPILRHQVKQPLAHSTVLRI